MKIVPIEDVKIIYQEEVKEAIVKVTVKSYAKGILYITIENLLDNYRLKVKPEIRSRTGDVSLPATKDNNELSFNFTPKGPKAVNTELNDISVSWTLDEIGEDAFLISKKLLEINLVYESHRYKINYVRVLPVQDME